MKNTLRSALIGLLLETSVREIELQSRQVKSQRTLKVTMTNGMVRCGADLAMLGTLVRYLLGK